MMGDWGWGMGGFGIILNIALWVLLIAGIIWLVRRLLQSEGRRRSETESGSRALDILNERYARGEIDQSQYESIKRDIQAH
jgi:putative membrane protein